MMTMELESWLRTEGPSAFPYDAVIDEYQRVGKHFVAPELLTVLAAVRAALPDDVPGDPSISELRRFLETALDKWDGRYDYPSYTALCVLPMPSVDDADRDASSTLRRRDRLVLMLLADVIAFELAARDGETSLLPLMRPDARTVQKRCRLALRTALPALERLGSGHRVEAVDPEPAARELIGAVIDATSTSERRILRLSMLPVYVSHDEYLFIRVLQLFETTFAMIALQLSEAVKALQADDLAAATERMTVAEATLRESAPLFSLLANDAGGGLPDLP